MSFDNLSVTYYRGAEIEEDHYYPFGLNIETASADPSLLNNIKYNSKELQRTEFADAYGNTTGLQWEDYGARMQDPQIGRWNGIDGKAAKYFNSSPYAYCMNNPVYYNDPDGQSGEATITDKVSRTTGHKIIDVVANVHLYGQDATQDRATKMEANLNDSYNNCGKNFTTEVNGETYDVVFQISVDVISSADVDQMMYNLNPEDNFYEVRNDVDVRTDEDASKTFDGDVSHGAKPGGSTGVLKTSDLDNALQSDSHELNHGFAGENKDGMSDNVGPNADIAVPKGKALFPETRVVTQHNIDMIFQNVKFDPISGTGNVGNPTPYKFDKQDGMKYVPSAQIHR